MSDRCSCEPGTMNYRCSRGRPCDVHGAVDALMAWGEYVDRRGGVWQYVQIMSEWVLPVMGWANGSWYLNPAQMRLRIVREQHRKVCPGLRECVGHPVVHVIAWEPGWFSACSGDTLLWRNRATFAEAIDAAQQLAKETNHGDT